MEEAPLPAVTQRRSIWSRIGTLVLRLTQAVALIAILGAFALVMLLRKVEADLGDVRDLRTTYRPAQVTRVLGRDGALLAELFVERRTIVSIKTLPAHMKLAVLAAEDAGFYEHQGLNYVGMLRAFVVNQQVGMEVVSRDGAGVGLVENGRHAI